MAITFKGRISEIYVDKDEKLGRVKIEDGSVFFESYASAEALAGLVPGQPMKLMLEVDQEQWLADREADAERIRREKRKGK